MRILILIFIFLLHSFLYSNAQVNKEGVPLITNYFPKQYNAHNENWMSVANRYGILYFANTSGLILEYDGKSWNHIPTKKKTVIYSLACDTNGVIYVGSQGDFGYVSANKFGKLYYQSLAENMVDSFISKQTFWKTYVGKNQEVYFCSPLRIYIFKQNRLTSVKLPKNSWLSFYINNRLYVSNSEVGLLEFTGTSFIPVKGFEIFKGSDIQIIDEINSHEWLVFNGVKFYQYKTSQKKCIEISEKSGIWDYLINNYAYYTISLPKLHRIWSTINGGVVITSHKWGKNYIINDSLGLTSSQVSSVNFLPIDGTVWATTLNGISKIEYQNPLKLFGPNQSLKGNVYSIRKFKDKLYVATSNGLYVLEKNKFNTFFKKVSYFKDNIVNYLEVIETENGERLWISSQNTLFEYDGILYKRLFNQEIITEYILKSKYRNNIFIGTQNGLYKFDLDNRNLEKLANISEFITSIVEDNKENIWFSTLSNGVFCYSKEGKLLHINEKNGLPVLNDIYLFYLKGEVLLCTSKGLFVLDKSNYTITKSTHLGNWINKSTRNIISCYKGYNNQLWLNISNRLYLLIPHYDSFKVDSITFNRIPESTIYNVYTEPSGVTWIGTNEGLFSYDPKFNYPKSTYYCLIRNIRLSYNDSVIFYGTYFNPETKISYLQEKSTQKFMLDYKYNALTFMFAAPFYHEEQKTMFSYILEGFDDHWSSWTTENKAIYTNIPEGKYTFKVKARNIYNQESQIASFSFEILPPWYRTIWAYIGYFLTTIVLFIVTIKLYTRKLEADKKRLEKIVEERTAEIVKQKNEIEEKNKVIEEKNKDITDSIYYAKRIQEAILPPKDNFGIVGVEMFVYYKPKDIVSGDFYFIRNIERSHVLVVAAADCTGHGVPGAFMSMLGASLLNELITRTDINHTDVVLNELRSAVIKSLNQEGKDVETKDGMDIALIAYNYKEKKLEFSGANNPMYLVRNNELIEYKADKMPVGLYERRQEPFTRTEIEIMNNDIVYLFSDGFADQFGGEQGKKYMYKRFKEFLLSIHHLPMNEQEDLIDKEALNWRGNIEQIDDHLVIGIRFVF
ncbi:MAG: SpoIIE family protein phosphatase [Bacteroidales bacterium]|nr:SpoIIE family protein phosphatase [Bacteroidales bacterium]